MEIQSSKWLDTAALSLAFRSQLNTVYRAKSHLSKHLPELKDRATFINLKYALAEEIDDVARQLLRLEKIFVLLKLKPSGTNCLGIDAILKEAFINIERCNANVFQSDLALTFYMSVIEHIEISGYRMLRLISPRLERREIDQLLVESYDEAKDSAKLFTMISQEYISG